MVAVDECGSCECVWTKLVSAYYSRSYAEDVTSVTSGASQGPHSFNSRSYAEDITSVTSGASQGPHSFNLVFVCLFVCVFVSRLELSYPVSFPYLSRICDYKGSTGLYITPVHNICWLPYLSRTVPIFVVLCIRLPDIEGDLERNRETRRKLN